MITFNNHIYIYKPSFIDTEPPTVPYNRTHLSPVNPMFIIGFMTFRIRK